MHVVLHLLALIRALASDRSRLALENGVLMCRFFEKHLVIVKPETGRALSSAGFRYFWRWKSRAKPGRPPIASEIIHLIRRMSKENPLWGAPRIRDELALLGHKVCKDTVSKYMVRGKEREPSQSWRTFLANHMAVSAACDFFTVPTLTSASLSLRKTNNALRNTFHRALFRLYARRSVASIATAREGPRMDLVLQLLALIRALASDRSRLALENVVLRQQLNLLKRSVKRAKVEDSDRIFWVLMCRFFERWKEHLVIVKPETVVRWHRQGFRYYWRWKSRAKPGRPPIAPEIIHLIRRMSKENPLWGAPRIRDELALLGHKVCKDTVSKYMVRGKEREPSQSWRTFLSTHMAVSAACDFFTVPTLTFKLLYVFVVLSHDRRCIVQINVTQHPTAEWTANQITATFPGDQDVPRYLHRDRDSIYGEVFRRRVAAIGIREVVSAKQSPWQNPFVERVIGSIRRECTDHVIALGEGHLRSVLSDYVDYYNTARCHQSLEGNAPEPRDVESGPGAVRAIPFLGGLHHRYSRVA